MITYELDSLHESFLEITFEEGQFAGQKLYLDDIDTCSIATCDCYTLHLSSGDREFIFDVDEQTVMAFEEEDKVYVEAIKAQLTQDHWDDLFEKFTFVKGLQCELTPLSHVTKDFTESEYKEVLGDGLMFFYDEIFSHALTFKVTVDEVDYLLADAYCLMPSCDCHEVRIQVIDDEREESIFMVIYDTKLKTFRLNKDEEVTVPKAKADEVLAEIRREFSLAKVPGISLADRYQRVRAVFKDFLTRKGIPTNYHPETRLVATIGRNEPCICGSGKKYKKCCGE